MSQSKKEQFTKLVKGVGCDIPDNWWPGFDDDTKNRYFICGVDFTRDKTKPWYKRDIFEFEYESDLFHLNFEGLLEYVDPSTVPSSLCLETGFPWSDLPVSTYQRLYHAVLSRRLFVSQPKLLPLHIL